MAKGIVAFSAVLTTFFACVFMNRLALPFNSEGNYFDESEGIVYHEQAPEVYGFTTFLLLLFTTFLSFKKLKGKKGL